jgi:hypothetical protein
MKTLSHLWQYLANFFLEWEMFQTNIVEKIKTHILCSVTFFRKSCHLWDNAEKFGRARGATKDVTIWRIRFKCWISKAHAHLPGHPHALMHTRTHTHTHTHKYIILISFPLQQWFRERASVLHDTYIECCVVIVVELLIQMNIPKDSGSSSALCACEI